MADPDAPACEPPCPVAAGRMGLFCTCGNVVKRIRTTFDRIRPADPVPVGTRGRSVGELREGLIQMMDVEAWPDDVTIHESKEVLLRTPDGDYLLDEVGWSFVQGRIVVVLGGSDRDPRR